MGDQPAQRYLAIYALIDPDNLRIDADDLMYALARTICDQDSETHECPLIVMSSKGLTEEQHDLILEHAAMELQAAGWVVRRP